jgi:hypothetical protein
VEQRRGLPKPESLHHLLADILYPEGPRGNLAAGGGACEDR